MNASPLAPELYEQVRRLEIRARRLAAEDLGGRFESAYRGRGMEFVELALYQPGDNVRQIDWNVTARTGRTFIKRYVEERQLTVVYAIDTSASAAFGSVARTKARLLAEIGAAIGAAAQSRRDRFGLLRFSDAIEAFVPPGRGPRHAARIMRDLVNLQPAGQGLAIAETTERLRRLLRRHAVVFIAGDWLLPPDDALRQRLETALKMLNRRHEVIAVRATDPRELDLPPVGLVELRDPETGRRRLVDTSSRAVRDHHRSAAAAERERTESLLRRSGIDLIDVATDRPFITDLLRYFRTRERRR